MSVVSIVGSYEEFPARYKHVYFNATWNTLVIYCLSAVTLIATYEIVKRTSKLILTRQARLPLVLVLISSFYAHAYSFWTYFNVYNDDYFDQIWHQSIFSSTELVSSILVFQMCRTKSPLNPRKLLTVVSLAAFHIVSSLLDQFFTNVVQGQGEVHQVVRDVGFMTSDLLHVILCSWYLRRQTQGSSVTDLCSQDVQFAVVGVCVLTLMSRIV